MNKNQDTDMLHESMIRQVSMADVYRKMPIFKHIYILHWTFSLQYVKYLIFSSIKKLIN